MKQILISFSNEFTANEAALLNTVTLNTAFTERFGRDVMAQYYLARSKSWQEEAAWRRQTYYVATVESAEALMAALSETGAQVWIIAAPEFMAELKGA